MLRFLMGMGMEESFDNGASVYVVRLDHVLAEDIPEPNCDDPTCDGCMMLRELRGETIESNPGVVRTQGRPRPSDGPPIII